MQEAGPRGRTRRLRGDFGQRLYDAGTGARALELGPGRLLVSDPVVRREAPSSKLRTAGMRYNYPLRHLRHTWQVPHPRARSAALWAMSAAL